MWYIAPDCSFKGSRAQYDVPHAVDRTILLAEACSFKFQHHINLKRASLHTMQRLQIIYVKRDPLYFLILLHHLGTGGLASGDGYN